MFFEGKQAHFFRPLASSAREKYAFALKAIYDRLYSSDALFDRKLDRAALTELIERAITQAPTEILSGADEMVEVGQVDAAAIIRELAECGWLESYMDMGLVTKVWRLTPVGKMFAQGLWRQDHPPQKTRHRNMRSCHNALSQYLQSGDPDELLDALSYAEQVVNDLTSDIEDLRLRITEATTHKERTGQSLQQFVAFLREDFSKELAPKLTEDSAYRLKGAISRGLRTLRETPPVRLQKLEQQLRARVVVDASQDLIYVIIYAERIERLVRTAVDAKIPELVQCVNGYITRMSSLMIQTSTLDGPGRRNELATFCQDFAQQTQEGQDQALDALAHHAAPCRIRLYHPGHFEFQSRRIEAQVPEEALLVKLDPFSVLQAEIRNDYNNYMTFAESDVVRFVKACAGRAGRIRLSQLPTRDGRELLLTLAAEVYCADRLSGVQVRALPGTACDNDYFNTEDVEFVILEAASPANETVLDGHVA